jgi:hypothetical protein
MYLPPDGGSRLLIALHIKFPRSELLYDVVPLWLIAPAVQWISKIKGSGGRNISSASGIAVNLKNSAQNFI